MSLPSQHLCCSFEKILSALSRKQFLSGRFWERRLLMPTADAIIKRSINCIAVWRMATNCACVHCACIVNQGLHRGGNAAKCFQPIEQSWLKYCGTLWKKRTHISFFHYFCFWFEHADSFVNGFLLKIAWCLVKNQKHMLREQIHRGQFSVLVF